MEQLQEQIDRMKQEIDGLQIVISRRREPWYRNVPTILSLVALLFSFVTTFVAYRRETAQDVQNMRTELRVLLQRMAALPKENVAITKEYANDPASLNQVGTYINQENALLSGQAAEIARKLPSGMVSAAEYYAIAVALQSAYDLEEAKEFLNYSLETADTFNIEISARRMSASLHFIQGDPEAGRAEYQQALDIFAKYPGYDQFTIVSTDVWTELAWATSEASIGSSTLADQHIANAEALLAQLSPSPGLDMLKAQVAQTRGRYGSGAGGH